MPVLVLVKASEPSSVRRTVYFQLFQSDGVTPATGEAGGQPQISTDGNAWTNTGIGILQSIGNGRYYAVVTQAAIVNVGDSIVTRYKSANTLETEGDSIRVTAFDLYDAVRGGLTALPNADASGNSGLPVVGAQIPNAVAGTAGGLIKLGVNTGGVTLAPTTGAALTLSSADADVVAIQGNAAGAGVNVDAGSAVQLTGETGPAVFVSCNVNGVPVVDIGSGGTGGYGVRVSGGADSAGRGVFVQGGTAVAYTANAATGHAISATAGAFGDALHLVGGATAGKGVNASGATGVNITGSANQGVSVTGSSSSQAVNVSGGQGVVITASAGVGWSVTGGGNNAGAQFVGGAGGGAGHGVVFQRGASNADDWNLATSDAPTIAAALFASLLNGTYTLKDLAKDLVAAVGSDVTVNGSRYTLPTTGWGSANTAMIVSDNGNGNRTIVRS